MGKMKYYSVDLNEMFDSEKELKTAESKAIKEQETKDKEEKTLKEEISNWDKKIESINKEYDKAEEVAHKIIDDAFEEAEEILNKIDDRLHVAQKSRHEAVLKYNEKFGPYIIEKSESWTAKDEEELNKLKEDNPYAKLLCNLLGI